MTAIVSIALIVVLASLLVRWLSAAPLVRTLSTAIDVWADSVQGRDSEARR